MKIPEVIEQNKKLYGYVKDLAANEANALLIIPKALNEAVYTVIDRFVKGGKLDILIAMAIIPILAAYSVAAIADASTGYKLLRVFSKQKLTIENFHKKNKNLSDQQNKNLEKIDAELDKAIMKINRKIDKVKVDTKKESGSFFERAIII